jgi:NitT/TauT family transport system substrate-binding protein
VCGKKKLTALCGIGIYVALAGSASAVTVVHYGTTSPSAASWMEFIAQDQGFFQAEGLDVQMTFTGNNTTVVQQLIGGSFDLGQTTFETTVRAVDKGAPISMIATTMTKYSYSIVAQKNINSINDMVHKRIILALPKSALTIYWNRALEQAGIKVSDVEQVYDGSTPNRYAALVSGTAQAAALTQPVDLLAMDKGFNKIVDITKVAKGFGFTCVVASRDWLKNNAATAKAYLRALKKATSFFYDKKNRQSAIDSLAKHSKINAEAAGRTYDYFVNELQPYDRDIDPNDSYVKTVAQLLIDIGDKKAEPIDPAKYADRSFLPK